MAGEAWMNNPALADAAINRANSDARYAAEQARGAGIAAAAHAAVKHRETVEHYERNLFDAKRALHGQVAIKNALRQALKEVAPDHPMVSPEDDNPILKDLCEQAEDSTKPNDPWWP